MWNWLQPVHMKNLWSSAMGRTCQQDFVGQHGRNVTVTAATCNLARQFYYEIHGAPVTKEVFINYTTSPDAMLSPKGAVILKDNVPCHVGCEQVFLGHFIKRLPPHFPFRNPTETCFSVLKSTMKRKLNKQFRYFLQCKWCTSTSGYLQEVSRTTNSTDTGDISFQYRCWPLSFKLPAFWHIPTELHCTKEHMGLKSSLTLTRLYCSIAVSRNVVNNYVSY